MPEKMASHWNAQGVVDGYMSRFWGLFMLPLFTGGLFLLFIVLPKIDPLKRNWPKFRNYYDWFVVILTSYMFYIYMLTLSWSLGYRFDMGVAMTPAIGVLFIYLGFLMEKAKRNWFVGIRTPWTLSSDRVWKNTHRIGSKLFKICGVIAVIGAFLGKYAFYAIIIPVLATVVYTVVYSYFDYQNEHR
jgi:uncharacterized membrane protein